MQAILGCPYPQHGGGMRTSARGTQLPPLVPKDRSRASVHQVRFSICREEVCQDRVVPESMWVSYRKKLSSKKDRGLGQEGLGVNSGNVWSQRGAEICL